MAIKKLPIVIQPLITSECWTYYKMAIIQTVSNYDLWLACHLKMYTNEEADSYFGESRRIYPLSYFSEILDIKEKNILSISGEEIIDYIVGEIDKGNYLVIDANLNRLHNNDSNDLMFHEILIYGYDTERSILYSSLLINSKFQEVHIDFEVFRASFIDILNYYIRNRNRILERRKYFYGITIFSPKNNYCNDNVFFEFIEKLNFEYKGIVYKGEQYLPIRNNDQYSYCCTGISCIVLLADTIKQNLEILDKTELIKNRNSCLKIYENENIILRSLKWFANIYAQEGDELYLLIDNYAKCCEQLYNCVLAFYKYELCGNSDLLKRIVLKLYDIYEVEKGLLEKMIALLTELYVCYLRRGIEP